jgi:N12 class adenine-specific DNA methylase
MTKQAKSDVQIKDRLNEIRELAYGDLESITKSEILIYQKAESEYLPIINQQAEEIEKLRGQGITTLNDYREEVRMRLEAQTERDNLLQENEELKEVHENDEQSIRALGNSYDKLKSRFDELLKSLEGLLGYISSSDPYPTMRERVAVDTLQSLISKAKGTT